MLIETHGRRRRPRLIATAWLALMALCPALPSLAQHQIRFESISIEDGLTQSTATCVFQDSRGFLWVGTHNGLHRYDGHGFIDFRHGPDQPETIANDHITALCEDRRGFLWIGTHDGLSKLVQPDIPGGRFVNYAPIGQGNGPLRGVITALCVDSQGILWIGTPTGLCRLDTAGGKIEPYPAGAAGIAGLNIAPISAILEDREGELWIGTAGLGLHRLDQSRQQAAVYRRHSYRAGLRYTSEALTAVSSLAEGRDALAAIVHAGNNSLTSVTFGLKEAATVLVVSLGEGVDKPFDYAAIAAVGTPGPPLWTMDMAEARHAGGSIKNRLQVALVPLAAGDYSASFTSDDSHAFAAWNAEPPDQPDWWGVRVYPLSQAECDELAPLIRAYEPRNAIISDRISALAEDGEGTLWIGTADRGLCRWSRHRQYFSGVRNHLPTGGRRYSAALLQRIESLRQEATPLAQLSGAGDEEDRSLELRLDQPTKVLLVCGGSALENQLFDGALLERAGRQIWAMTYDESAHAGGNTVNRLQCALLDLAPGNYTLRYRSDRFYSPGHWGEDGPDDPEFWGVHAFDVDEATAAALTEELATFEERPAIPGLPITSLAVDPAGRLWIGTYSGGLGAIGLDDNAFAWFRHDPDQPDSPAADIINDLVVDRSGILWAGTELHGISILDPHKHRFKNFTRNAADSPTLAAEQVFSFFQDGQGFLYVGTDRGLSLLDPKRGIFLPARPDHPLIRSLANARVTCLLQDDKGDLWIGTGRDGLFRTRSEAGDQRPLLERMDALQHFTAGQRGGLNTNYVTDLLQDEQGAVWIATVRGLHRFRDERFEDFYFRGEGNATANYVRTLLQDRQQRLWAGTDGGLCLVNRESGELTAYTNRPGDRNSISHNIVSALLEREGRLWVGTYGGGLNQFDPATGQFRRFTERDGLPNNVIYGILADELGGLWLSSNKGLSRLDPVSGRFRNYNAGDGLQSNEFNSGACLQLAGGDMVFGGVKGFNLFDPNAIRRHRQPPPIAVTAVKSFGRNLEFEQPLASMAKIELDHTQDFLSFEFVALDFSNPDQNSYAHMLGGYNKDWIPNGNRRFASYTNLDPGDYIFRVKGANNDGIWNETGASIRISIRPPYWQSWWFRTLAGLLLTGAVVMAYTYRIRHLRREQGLREEFAKRLIQSQESERRRIAAELHDSLGQNLLVINNEIQHQAQLAADRGEQGHFDDLASLTLDAINEVRDIAYDLHPHQLERLGLKRAVESVVNRVAMACECEFHLINADIDGVLPRDMEINFFRIIQEAVNNIIKHADAANATIEITRRKTEVAASVSDDGAGFEVDIRSWAASGGIGFAGMTERARLLGGRLKVTSAPGAGTRLELVIPIPLPPRRTSLPAQPAGLPEGEPQIKGLPP